MVQSRKRKSAPKETSPVEPEETQPPALQPGARMPGKVTPVNDGFENILGEVEDYAIIFLDPTGKILSWNRGAEKIKGYSAREIIGRNYRIFYVQEDKDSNLPEQLLEEAIKKGGTHYEGWRLRKDGSRFWGYVALTALHTEGGGIRGFLKVTRDMTEKRVAEDNYSNFVEELKLKNEALAKSEERYHKMISEVIDYAIILLDKEGKILDWNKGAEKLKGYTASEIVGKSFRLFYPREEKEARVPEQLLEEAILNGSVTHEGWRIRKNGERFWGLVTITSLHDANDQLIGFSKITRDLTQRKIAEDKMSIMLEELTQANGRLKQSEERYHRMIAEVQDYAIILLTREGNIENWNTGAEFIKGYKAHEVVGKNFKIFYSEEDRQRKLPETLLREAATKGKATHEGWRVRKDGSRFWGSIVITALHDSSGEIIGFSKVTRDLTERKNSEDVMKVSAAQLDLQNKTLARLNEELSSFTYVASHDMKEPLRKIQTYARRIESVQFDPEKSGEFLEKIRNSAIVMQNLIDDLLSYSQVSNDTRSSFEKTDLNKIVQSVVNDLEVAIHEKQAVIDAERLPVVPGIPYQLRQLFLNLISNSIKFSKPDEPPQVIIRAEMIKGPDIPGDPDQGTNKFHHISVSDNGIGFPQQQNDKIFEAFQRLHPKSTFAGTGIGLAIVKKVIENHNGLVSAEGSPGAGATFHLYLPVLR